MGRAESKEMGGEMGGEKKQRERMVMRYIFQPDFLHAK